MHNEISLRQGQREMVATSLDQTWQQFAVVKWTQHHSSKQRYLKHLTPISWDLIMADIVMPGTGDGEER